MTSSRSTLDHIEVRSIDYVPHCERHARLRDQGPFWFLGNFHFLTIAVGFIGPSMNLSLGWTALASILGILLGTVFQAFHASQGAELGLPQMIQSRAQFGYRGVVLPLAGALFTFVGFNVVDSLLLKEGLQHLWGIAPYVSVVVLPIIAAVLAIWGHDFLHLAFRVLFWCSLPLYLMLTVAIILGYAPLHAGMAPHPAKIFNITAFATQFAAAASFNITYAPYVSDYSRYLPARTSRPAIIATVFAGSAVSAIWLIILGAWLASHTGSSDGLIAILQIGNRLFPAMGLLLCLSSIGALIAVMGMNTYSAMLSMVTGWDSIIKVQPNRRIRVKAILFLTIVCIVVALACGGNAIGTLSATLVMMLYLLCPWTAVNLADYFLLRKGRYAISHLMRTDGIYGNFGMRGIFAYGVGFAASVPLFVIPGVWTGPLAVLIGGVDIAWLVELIVSGIVYMAANINFDPADEAKAITESAAELATLEVRLPL